MWGNSLPDFSRAFGSLDRLKEAKEEELLTIEGIGPTVADSVRQFF